MHQRLNSKLMQLAGLWSSNKGLILLMLVPMGPNPLLL
jgi:hypothetical protein